MDQDFTKIDIDTVAPLARNADPVALVGGFTGLFATLVGMLLLPSVLGAVTVATHPQAPAQDPFSYVEARLLRKGEIKEPDRLPDRIVPQLPTAPEEVLPLDRQERKPQVEAKPVEKKQRDAGDDDKRRQVFDRARAFDEIQDDYVPVGHPDGVPDGDVSDPALASAGDMYAREISQLISERWVISTLISDAERKKLRVTVLLRFNASMGISAFQITHKSGNALFDDSVLHAIERLQTEVRRLPDPPEAVAPRVFGGGLSIRLHGVDAEGK